MVFGITSLPVRGLLPRYPRENIRDSLGISACIRKHPRAENLATSVETLAILPLPPRPGRGLDELAAELDGACEWLIANSVLPADLVTRNRRIAEAALRPWRPVFIHGDLQLAHLFVDGDEVTGVIDWSEAASGDAMYDLATLTLGHTEHLGDVVAGYGTDVDLGVIRAWWSLRSLRGVRWLVEHGFDPSAPGCEVDVLKAQAG
ncbi:phosphotransferase family protein [Nocardia fluminea]|uniref:phosphotransferase family protein n=1 Tax=Nocardia fluminea TaxID=134984 RepID=UPI00371989FF